MAKALDTRVVAKAKYGDIRLTLNVKLVSRTETEPGVFTETVTYCQMASIDYELLDAEGAFLGQRTLTHQTAGVAEKPSLQQAINAVLAELKGWISADRIALSDVDA